MLFLALFVTNTPPKRVIREDVRVIRDGSSHTPERLSTSSQLPLSLSLSLSASRPRPPHSGRVESAVHRCGRRCGRRCGARQSAGARVRGMAALHALRNQLARVLHAAGQRLPLLLKHLELVAEQNLLIAKLCVRNRAKQKRRKYLLEVAALRSLLALQGFDGRAMGCDGVLEVHELFQNRELGRLQRLQLARLALLLRLERRESVDQRVALLLEMLKGAVFRLDLFVILVDSTLDVFGTIRIDYSSVREADSASC